MYVMWVDSRIELVLFYALCTPGESNNTCVFSSNLSLQFAK